MGGTNTAVSLDTRNVYLEAAFWWPDAIRGRARRYNLRPMRRTGSSAASTTPPTLITSNTLRA